MSAQGGHTSFSTRLLQWTIDNRLFAVSDDQYFSYYAYDHTGERTLKMTGDATSVNQNAFNNHIYSSLNNVTLYPSPYLVLTNSGYTKHYYAGADRVCARIGSGGLNQDTTGIRGTSEISQCVDSLFLHCIEQMNNYVPSADTGNIVTIDGEALLDTTSTNTNKTPTGLHVDVVPNITRFNAVFEESLSENHSPRAPYYEPDVYFYHSDHLGGASWITDGEGNAVQHLQYLPFGQPFVNQHPAGYQERYTFTGKELDSETGYGYHGARYMDYELLTCWLSVDPMADKYPNISPYAYCIWNPVKLVDPDGNIVLPIQNSSPQFIKQLNQAKYHLYTHGAGSIIQQLDMLPVVVYVNEISYDEALAGRGAFTHKNMTINWCPVSGMYTDENHILSPTTILNHEFDHALQFLTHPNQWKQDIAPDINNQYDNKEEERVITRSERKTAISLGEIQPSQITRTSHSGAANRVEGPTSTDVQPPYKINTPLKTLEEIDIE